MIRIAVIGAGHWGPNLVRNFHSGQASTVTHVIDTRVQRLEQIASRYPGVTFGTDARAAFDDPQVDAVVVATPTATHFAVVRQALEAGKHVLVEKPITTTVREAEVLQTLASKLKRVLMVGHVFLFNPAVQRVKQLLEKNELGRIHYLSMVRTNLGPIRGDVNAAWDLASHDISIADYWLGHSALAVSAVGASYVNPGIQDAVFATVTYPQGVLVNLHCSWLNPRKARDITVVGDRRMLTFDDMNLNEPLRVYDKGVVEPVPSVVVDTFASFRASVRDGDITIPKLAMGEPLKAECDHFLECIARGTPVLTDASRGASVVKVLEGIERSLALRGAEVTL